jgi:hypothetical protein
MKPGLVITKVWSDDDCVELKVDVSDGTSFFSTKVYVAHKMLVNVLSDLENFKNQVNGGIVDIRFGEFGPEYANGAFHGRLHFAKTNRLYITCRIESDFQEFSINKVAPKATLYLKTEPVLLDNFIAEFRSLKTNNRVEATLQAV